MTDEALGADPTVSVREQLSSLQGLLVLSMLMTERDEEHEILKLAATSVASLGPCRLLGVFLLDTGWRLTEPPADRLEVQLDLETQFAVLSDAGGALAVPGEAWGWAHSLRSLDGHFGYLLVSADGEPPGSDQFLLRVLAQQAGVALANAHLHARDRDIASELRATNLALEETVSALERSTAIHARLTRAAVAGEGQEGIAQAIHELTGYPVAIEDAFGNLRAWAGPGRPDPYPKDDPTERARILRRAIQEEKPIRVDGRLVAVARPDHEVLGVLALVDPTASAGDAEHVTLEHGAVVLAVELGRLRGLAEAELRLGRELVEELLSGNGDGTLLDRAQVLGYDLARPHRVVVVEPRGRVSGDPFFLAVRRAARDMGVGTLLIPRGGSVVLVADGEPAWEAFRLAIAAESGGQPCRLGVGMPAEVVADLPRSYREAQLALRLQDASGAENRSTDFEDLGVYRILAELQDLAAVERYVDTWLGTLLEYDRRKGSELVATLSTYLDCGRSYDATSRTVNVHRSTLKYRLQRIGELSGLDLADPDVGFNLQLAGRAWRTLSALRDVPSA